MDLKEETSKDLKEETYMDSEKPSMDSKKKQIFICPRVEAEVQLREGRFYLIDKIHGDSKQAKCEADTNSFNRLMQIEGIRYVRLCDGNGHEECYKSAPIKHVLHPKHTLMFVKSGYGVARTRKCLCCEEPLNILFYWCPSCDLGINLACLKKETLITIDPTRRHEHTLTLFPRQVTTNCNICALDDSRIGSIYICPACDFVVHKRCIDLPWSIRISRHPQHRLYFTSSFAFEDLICNICRRKINSEYGGYICKKEGCSYFAHSRCATGKNVWDGQELEKVPEEVEEVKPPFEMLRDGIIRHFSHEHHPLKLNIEDTTRVYDENRSCQACVMPIYDGNFYSCTQDCSFILHETCANISRRIYHAIHPHPLVLQMKHHECFNCSACGAFCSGFFYECSLEECGFTLHIQCATIYEPLMHNSHVHPLFLTSAPEEKRSCSICKDSGSRRGSNETFNCIKSECEFSLCFKCAVLPQKVRYKHDEHFLTLFYGEETQHWCELCEMKIDSGERFYACEDYCCVTLHIECLLGENRNYRLGSYSYFSIFDVIRNGMTRPVCSRCHHRCKQKIVFQLDELKYCCYICMHTAW